MECGVGAGAGDEDENGDWDAAADEFTLLAEARRTMLDPPQVKGYGDSREATPYDGWFVSCPSRYCSPNSGDDDDTIDTTVCMCVQRDLLFLCSLGGSCRTVECRRKLSGASKGACGAKLRVPK